MDIKDELVKLIGKPCWFSEGTLEIRKNSDAQIIGVDGNGIVVKNILFDKVKNVPFHAIKNILRKD